MTSFARRLLLTTCLGVLGLAYACGDDAPAEDHEHDETHDHDAAAADTDDQLDEEVPCDANYPSFTAGMSVKAGAYTVKLQSITPAPPRQKVKNNWVLQILDASGQPASGLTFTNASSYMPVHRHGGNRTPVGVAAAEAGSYQLNDIDFIMRGPWQVLFDVQQGSDKIGTATIQICVE